jgi:hypothetical protein
MRKLATVLLVACAGLAAVPPALAQGKRYEPPQRLRAGGMDTCMKDEVMNGNYCVKQCAEGFRMELGKREASCIGLTASAQIPPPPKPNYTPPEKPMPGAKGT